MNKKMAYKDIVKAYSTMNLIFFTIIAFVLIFNGSWGFAIGTALPIWMNIQLIRDDKSLYPADDDIKDQKRNKTKNRAPMVVPIDTDDDIIDGDIEHTIMKALKENVDVSIFYRKPDGEISTRTITPRRIEGPYLKAYCHRRDSMRTFKLCRIQQASPV